MELMRREGRHELSGGSAPDLVTPPPPPPGVCLLGGGVQEVPGAVTMVVAGNSQSGWGQSLAVGDAVAGGRGASNGIN